MAEHKTIKIKHSQMADRAAHAHTHAGPTHSQHPKRKKAGVSMGPIIVVVLILLGLAIGGYLSARKNRNEAARIGLQLEALRRDATTISDETLKTLNRIPAQAAGIDPLRKELKRAVEEVIGHPIDQKPAAPAPKIPPPATSGPSDAQADAPTPAPEAEQPDEDVPFGLPTREQIDARRAAEQAQAASRPAPAPAPTDKAAPASTRAAAAPSKRRGTSIEGLYRDAIEQADIVQQADLYAKRIAANLNEDLELLRGEQRLELAARKHLILKNHQEAATALLEETKTARAALDTLAEKIKTARVEFLRAAEEQRLRDEAERKRKAYAAKVAQETTQVDSTIKAVDQLWRTYQYSQALQKAEQLLAQTTSSEQQPRAQVLRDQAKALHAMQAFLIEAITKNPLQWGWRQSGGSRHITGATTEAILFTGGSCPWSQVQPAQFDFIIKNYLGNAKTPPSLQVSHAAAMGLFYHILGKPADANFYVRRGCDARPRSADDIRRLTPFAD